MKLSGIIEIYGMPLRAIVELSERKNKVGQVSPYRGGRWQAYNYVDGKQRHLGYYDHKIDAEDAAQLGRNLAQFRRQAVRASAGRIRQEGATRWKVRRRDIEHVTETFGEAVLVYDVLARIDGLPVIVEGYEMPHGLIDNRSILRLINVPVFEPRAEEVARYERCVADLNEGINPTPY